MAGQRPHHGQAAALGREHARDVQEGLRGLAHRRQAELAGHAVLAVQREGEIEQLGLGVADQPRQRDGGAHVRQRIVRRLVQQAVGLGEVLELEAGAAVLLLRPLDAVGPQRIGQAHHVEQVPTAAFVLPLARIGIDEVAPEQEARDLVVEADGVVAHADGAGLREGALDLRRELVLGQAAFEAQLRRDAGDQRGLGTRQVVGRGLAIDHQRLADLVERRVGADGGELRGPVAARHGAEGFVVVPEEGLSGHVVVGKRKRIPGAAPGLRAAATTAARSSRRAVARKAVADARARRPSCAGRSRTAPPAAGPGPDHKPRRRPRS